MITGNEPAMPFESATMDTLMSTHLVGLTIRQHFAAMAMQGMLANHLIIDTLSGNSKEVICEWSVKYAEALINELNKQP